MVSQVQRHSPVSCVCVFARALTILAPPMLQVLRRMLKHEEAVIEVVPVGAGADADIPNEDRMLKLHPSYEISS